jgi:pyridinium-3,5-bisthiocarboxylic acid mononucleotide nickel chelatase
VTRLGWLDLSCGASGDMLLGALVGAGVDLAVIAGAVGALDLPVTLAASAVRRAGLAATKVDVAAAPDGTARPWHDVRTRLVAAPLAPGVRDRALAAFGALAAAEALVHGVAADDVHFHEVGALDAIADIVGVAAGLEALGLAELHASPVALGGGTAATAHGTLPVPGPAVLELLRAAGAPAFGGPVDVELCTPTGAALVTTAAGGYGPMPVLTATAVGTGAGGRDLPGRPNVVRLVIGERRTAPAVPAETAVLLESNVDDLDPRLWPGILEALLAGGASDAWLTPILMKKGRPAHTLSVLVASDLAAQARRIVFRETSTLGLRETTVGKRALDRRFLTVDVAGVPVAVKVGLLPDGTVTNVQPEWSDAHRAAAALGRPVKRVLAEATAAALAAWEPLRGEQFAGGSGDHFG